MEATEDLLGTENSGHKHRRISALALRADSSVLEGIVPQGEQGFI